MTLKRKAPRRKRQTAAEFRALQRLMAQAVMRPLTPSLRMRPRWTDGRATGKIAGSFIKPNDRLTAFERLEIYNRQYWLRVTECFYEDFPGLRAVLGEKRFQDLAIAYLARHPSASFTLRDLGRKLVEFIHAEPRCTKPHQMPALEMARLEWAHIEAFDNEARPPVTVDDLLGRDAAEIHLQLQPHISVLQLAYPLDDFLFRLRENTRLRGEASNAIGDEAALSEKSTGKSAGKKSKRKKTLPLPAPRTIWLAVHRHQNVVYYKRLQARQYELLTAIQRGASLEQALQMALSSTGKPPPIQEWFADWSSLGWFWLQ